MDALLSPEAGRAGLALGSFLAATPIPFSSEAVLFADLKLHPVHGFLAAGRLARYRLVVQGAYLL